MKFVAIFKLNERFKSSFLAVKKKQRKMTFSLKLNFNLICKRSFEMINLKKRLSFKNKVRLNAVFKQRRQENINSKFTSIVLQFILQFILQFTVVVKLFTHFLNSLVEDKD